MTKFEVTREGPRHARLSIQRAALLPGWNDHSGTLRVTFPNRKCDPRIAADLFHRYYDEYQICDELGLDLMLNEHHQSATCMSSAVVVGLAVLARATKKARLLVLGYPIGHRPDPLRVAEEFRPSMSFRAAASTWDSSRAFPMKFPPPTVIRPS